MELPDDAIERIFVSMPYKEVRSTGVLLSRNWKRVLQSDEFNRARWEIDRPPESWESNPNLLMRYALFPDSSIPLEFQYEVFHRVGNSGHLNVNCDRLIDDCWLYFEDLSASELKDSKDFVPESSEIGANCKEKPKDSVNNGQFCEEQRILEELYS